MYREKQKCKENDINEHKKMDNYCSFGICDNNFAIFLKFSLDKRGKKAYLYPSFISRGGAAR